jgi:hypothetical protein
MPGFRAIGIGAKEAAAANAGLTIQEAHDLIQAICADVTTNTPRCELGHGRAAQEALERRPSKGPPTVARITQRLFQWGLP